MPSTIRPPVITVSYDVGYDADGVGAVDARAHAVKTMANAKGLMTANMARASSGRNAALRDDMARSGGFCRVSGKRTHARRRVPNATQAQQRRSTVDRRSLHRGRRVYERTAPTAVPVAANTALVGVLSPNNEKVKVKDVSAQREHAADQRSSSRRRWCTHCYNSGPAIPTGVSLLAEITQGTATRRAAILPTQCAPTPGNTGKLPLGPCDMTFDAVASNAAPGSGTLIPGSATFTLHVMRASGGGNAELANKSITINLVAAPSITTLTLAPTTLVIDGLTPANYTASLQNPANSLQGVLLQGWIVQGATKRAAGGTLVGCGSATGVLPPGPCTMSFSASASSSAAGTGTLVPGAATFQLDLIQNSGGVSTTFDVKTVAVTLVSNSPKITSLALTSPVIVINGPSDNYTAKLQNPGSPVSDVLLQGELVQVQGASTITVAAGGHARRLRRGARCAPDDRWRHVHHSVRGDGIDYGSWEWNARSGAGDVRPPSVQGAGRWTADRA